jgi:hypothetical protein
MVSMLLLLLGVNEDIIKVYNTYGVNQPLEGLIHIRLECCRHVS